MNPAKISKKIRLGFYLALPAIQFFLLAAVLIFTSRCSPLAPSTDKNNSSSVVNSQNQNVVPDKITQAVQDNLVQNSFVELNSSDTQNILTSDFDKKSQSSIRIDALEISDKTIDAAFAQKSKSGELLGIWPAAIPLLSIPLSRDKLDTLYRDGQVRVDLLSLIRDADHNHVKNLLYRLQIELKNRNIKASSFLVFDDNKSFPTNNQTSLHLKLSLAAIEDRVALLDISRVRDNANEVFLESAIRDAKQLAIILE